MTAFMCLACADSGDTCPTCQPPTSLELTGLLIAVALLIVGVATTVLSCRGGLRWWT